MSVHLHTPHCIVLGVGPSLGVMCMILHCYTHICVYCLLRVAAHTFHTRTAHVALYGKWTHGD